MGTEREIKIALGSAADHAKLAQVLPPCVADEVQENSYWDSNDRRLTAARVLLRLRIEAEQATVTVKGQGTHSADGYFQCSEDEAVVDLAQARRVAAGESPMADLACTLLGALIRQHDLAQLHCWGAMRNRRRRHPLEHGWIAELDETHYPDGSCDWEVELEGDDPAAGRRQIQKILDAHGIAYQPQTLTKSQRLRQRL